MSHSPRKWRVQGAKSPGPAVPWRLQPEAIKRDPDFAAAYGMASWCFVWRKSNGWVAEPVHEIAEAMRLARGAAELGKDDAIALSRAGFSIAYLTGDVAGGSRLIDRALVLNPNLASAWYFSGWVRVWAGEPELAIAHLGHAMRLSPLDQILSLMHTALAFAHFLCGH